MTNLHDTYIDCSRGIAVPQHGFVLWWNARAMCTSLKTWLFRLLGYTVTFRSTTTGWTVRGQSVHLALGLLPGYEPQQHAHLFQFVVVKHPLARLASHFRQQAHCPGPRLHLDTRGPLLNEWPGGTFRRYVEMLVDVPQEYVDPHVRRQGCGLPSLDAVVRSERLKRDWPPVMRRVGLPEGAYPPLCNKSPLTPAVPCCADWPIEQFAETNARPPWHCFYDGALKRLAQQYYCSDFERFGYALR